MYNGTSTFTWDSFDKVEEKLITEKVGPLSFQQSQGSFAFDPGFRIRYFTFWWVLKDDDPTPTFAYDKWLTCTTHWKAAGTKAYQNKITYDRPDGQTPVLVVQGKILDIITDPITYGKNFNNLTGKMNFVEDTISDQL